VNTGRYVGRGFSGYDPENQPGGGQGDCLPVEVKEYRRIIIIDFIDMEREGIGKRLSSFRRSSEERSSEDEYL